MKQPHVEKGRFGRIYAEPRGKAIALRLPESIDKQARIIAGDNLTDFIREAVAEKLERDLKQNMSA